MWLDCAVLRSPKLVLILVPLTLCHLICWHVYVCDPLNLNDKCLAVREGFHVEYPVLRE